jgi:hypothetical protein
MSYHHDPKWIQVLVFPPAQAGVWVSFFSEFFWPENDMGYVTVKVKEVPQ